MSKFTMISLFSPLPSRRTGIKTGKKNSREINIYKMNPWGRQPSAAAHADQQNNHRFLFFSLRRGNTTNTKSNVGFCRGARWMIALNNTVSIYHTSDDCNGKRIKREREKEWVCRSSDIWKYVYPKHRYSFLAVVSTRLSENQCQIYIYTSVCVYAYVCTHTCIYGWLYEVSGEK